MRDATSSEISNEIESKISLSQNYPNPFNPSTSIQYQLPESQRVKVSVYDMLGREVSVLVNEIKPAGTHSVSWDASGMSSGIYMYRLETESFRTTRKMTLMK